MIILALLQVPPLTEPHKQKEDEEHDPHEYARRLKTNMMQIRQAVNPVVLLPDLLQAGVLSKWEGHLLRQSQGQPDNAWTVVMAAVLQRGQTAYKAFGAALLQHGYGTVFDTIQGTQVLCFTHLPSSRGGERDTCTLLYSPA